MPIDVSICPALRRASSVLLALAVLVVSSCWSIEAQAERSTFRTLGADQGLASLEGHCLAQDRAGNVLICTQHGVFAYDGKRFTNLGTEHGLRQGGIVYGIAVTASGYLAIQYSNGVYVSDEASDPSHPATSLSFHPADHPGVSFYTVRPHRLVTERDAIILLTEEGTIRIATSGHRRAHVESMSYEWGERALLHDAVAIFSVEGRLWETFDDSRICAADPGEVRCYDAKDGVSAGPWFDMASGPGGRILARSAAAVATFDPVTARWSSSVLPDQGGTYDTFESDLGFFRMPDGGLITQSVQGLDVLGPAGWRELTVGDGAPSGTIAGAMTDATGQVWFNILGRGLVRWVGYGHWDTLERTDGLSDGFPWQTARSTDGTLWVTTDNGVNQIVRRGTSLHVSQVIGTASYALAATPEGSVWAGFKNTVQVIDPVKGVVATLPVPGAETIVSGRDHVVWIGTARGLYRVDDSGSQPRSALLKTWRTPVHAIATDGKDGIYYLSGGQLHHWGSNNADVTVSDPALPDTLDPSAMAIAPDGSFWIGGSGGLAHVVLAGDHIGSYRPVPVADTRTTMVDAVMIDHRGWVWIGTSLGICVFDGSRWVSADADQGLLSNDVNENGIREDPDGSIWITTARGISHLRDPASLFVQRPLTVVVAEAHVGSIPVGDARLPYSHDPLYLEFETPNYGLERPVLFRHRLSGVDADWVTSSSAVASYPFVPPGRHILTVVGYDQLTHAQSAPTTLVIDIAYPWWRRWWSEILWAAVMAGLIYGGLRVRDRSLYARQAELERRVAEATEQLRYQASHDKLTGLLSRSEIETRLAGRLAGGQVGEELVIALLDIDHFKSINDNHGHLGGDEVLRALGRSISKAMRDGEVAGRYGGEEMLLVLKDADGCAAERVLDLHRSIRHGTFRVGDGPVQVTCSIGVAWAGHGDSWETLVGRADAALYEAKGAGRDRVVESRLHDVPVSGAE